MRKVSFLFGFLLMLATSGFSQPVVDTDTASAKAAEEIQTALVTKLNLPAKTAAKVIVIENAFYAKRAGIDITQNLSATDRETKLGEAVRSRYSALLGIPLTGRQMEDVIELVAQIRLVHKL